MEFELFNGLNNETQIWVAKRFWAKVDTVEVCELEEQPESAYVSIVTKEGTLHTFYGNCWDRIRKKLVEAGHSFEDT